MNTELLERLSGINPHPVDVEARAGAVTAIAVLHDIERRMGMQTQELTQPTTPKRRRGVLVALAAFAVVALVGAALAIASVAGGGDVPPGTIDASTTTIEAAPSTTAAPPVTAAPTTTSLATTTTTIPAEVRTAAATNAIAAMNAQDSDALAALLAPNALLRGGFMRSSAAEVPSRTSFEVVARLLELEYALGTEWEITGCEVGAVDRVSCAISATSDFHEALGFEPWGGELVLVLAPDGEIMILDLVLDRSVIGLFRDSGGPPGWTKPLQPFASWVERNHPGDLESMVRNEYLYPRSDSRAVELWAEYVSEFLASLES